MVGGKVAVAIGHKAEAGARTIYEFISDQARTRSRDRQPTTSRPSTAAKIAAGARRPQGTLTPTDLAPAWHAPVPLPPRREARAGRPAA